MNAHIDPDTLADILEAMTSAAARLRSPDQCQFTNKLAAAELDRARADLIEQTENAPDLLDLCRRAFRALDEDFFPQLRDDLRAAIEQAEEPTP